MSYDKQQVKPEKPEQVIDDIVTQLDNMHRTLVNEAAQVGFARDAMLSIRPQWVSIANASTSNPEAAQIYASGLYFLAALRDEVRAQQNVVAPISGLFNPTSGSIGSLINATGITASFMSSAYVAPTNYAPFPAPDKHKAYVERFTKLDPSLGQTYLEIWESLYSTRAEPERAALYLIRQAFDHFFEKLAPDDEVRSSALWAKKTEPGKQNQVWREERIRYVVATHVKDSIRARTLTASTKHMLDVYQGLNRAHKRGELDKDKARRALAEMRSILENWADAIGI